MLFFKYRKFKKDRMVKVFCDPSWNEGGSKVQPLAVKEECYSGEIDTKVSFWFHSFVWNLKISTMCSQKSIWHHQVKVDDAQFLNGDARWISGGILYFFLNFE